MAMLLLLLRRPTAGSTLPLRRRLPARLSHGSSGGGGSGDGRRFATFGSSSSSQSQSQSHARHAEEAAEANRKIREELEWRRRRNQREHGDAYSDARGYGGGGGFDPGCGGGGDGGGSRRSEPSWADSEARRNWLQKWGYASEAECVRALELAASTNLDDMAAIKKQYRKLAKTYHPDAAGSRAADAADPKAEMARSEQKFKEVSSAYRALVEREKIAQKYGSGGGGRADGDASPDEEEDDPWKYEHDPAAQERYLRLRNRSRVKEHFKARLEQEIQLHNALGQNQRTVFMVLFGLVLILGWSGILSIRDAEWRKGNQAERQKYKDLYAAKQKAAEEAAAAKAQDEGAPTELASKPAAE
eukprot:Rhum_TRINITY_DN14193_c0_g1::Rhum_TRINITY_DN14193_c0_g1_i1::g.71748::m.71748